MKQRSPWFWLALPACIGVLGRPATGQAPGAQDVPAGMLAFFAADQRGCPPGYRDATEASGRLVVGVTSGDAVGKLVGTPLENQEDRTHLHGYSVELELPYKSISAANGGNDQGAAAGRYGDNGMTAPAPSGLPFIQLVACVKQ